MRTLRGALAGAIALLLSASALSGAAQATADAAPAAPYTALTVHFEGWGYIDGNYSYEPSRNSLDVYQQTPNGYAIAMSGSGGSHGHWHNINVTPPIGTRFVAGTTYPTVTNFSPQPDKTVLNISGDGQDCSGPAISAGSLAVTEAVYDNATGKFAAFAATYSVSCGGARVAKGEIRFQSSVGYRAADNWNYQVQMGQQPVGFAGTPQDVTVEVNGTLSSTFGAATLSGTDPAAFQITSNTCSGTTQTFGQTCKLSITPNATALGAQSAILTLPDDSVGGEDTWLLSLEGFDPRDATVSPSYLDFGSVPAYDTSVPKTVTLTGSGKMPITFGQAAIAGQYAAMFKITDDGCSTHTLANGQTCMITAQARPTAVVPGGTGAVLSLPDNSFAGSTQFSLFVNGFTSDRGTYYPLSPNRIMDTRFGTGGHTGKIPSGGVVHLQVTGNQVPADASTVVLNVTVTGADYGGYLSVWPTGVAQPIVSSLNFGTGWTGANSVTVKVGDNGQVDFFNGGGPVHIIADVFGYYSKGRDATWPYMGGQYHPLASPVRLDDTRTWGSGRVPGGYYINAAASWNSTIDPHVRAFAVNITATDAAGPGYLTAWNGDNQSLPNTSTLNYTQGATVPNFAIVPTTLCSNCGSAENWPSIGVFTSNATHIIVDIVGFYDDGTLSNGLRFEPIVPTRIADTRNSLGWPSRLGQAVTATITAPDTVAGADTWALATNVTAVLPSGNTFLTVWPAGVSGVGMPSTSNLNPTAGTTVPNAVQTMIGPANQFNVYNNAGSCDVVVDVVGTFYIYPPSAPAGWGANAYSFALPGAATRGKSTSDFSVTVPTAASSGTAKHL